MRRVLITQIGFVTMVLLAPATIEDQKFTTMVLSAGCQQSSEGSRAAWQLGTDESSVEGGGRTVMLAYDCFAFVIDGEPDGPSGQIAHDYGAEASVHATQTLISPYYAGRAKQAFVHLGLANVDPPLQVDPTLGLELGLDDVEGAGYYTRSEPSYRTGQRVELRVGSLCRPSLEA